MVYKLGIKNQCSHQQNGGIRNSDIVLSQKKYNEKTGKNY